MPSLFSKTTKIERANFVMGYEYDSFYDLDKKESFELRDLVPSALVCTEIEEFTVEITITITPQRETTKVKN